MTPALIHYPPGATLPAPWQPNWQGGGIGKLASIRGRHVARAPHGTPLPPGAEPYAPPVVTDALREIARVDARRLADGPDGLYRDLAAELLEDRERLDIEICRALGEAHPYATLAPLSVETLEEACDSYARALDEWASPCSTAVIRCNVVGYQVWTGVGSLMHHEGKADTYEQSEQMAVEGIRRQRAATTAALGRILSGWSPDTHYYSATISTLDSLPWSIHRGPITAEELTDAKGLGASSWDLPVVATYRGDAVERYPERVSWSDDESRERARAKQREGEARRKAEVDAALALLGTNPALAPLVLPGKGLRPNTDLTLRNGQTVRVVGQVRMRSDDRVGLALVKVEGRRVWMALGEFA